MRNAYRYYPRAKHSVPTMDRPRAAQGRRVCAAVYLLSIYAEAETRHNASTRHADGFIVCEGVFYFFVHSQILGADLSRDDLGDGRAERDATAESTAGGLRVATTDHRRHQGKLGTDSSLFLSTANTIGRAP